MFEVQCCKGDAGNEYGATAKVWVIPYQGRVKRKCQVEEYGGKVDGTFLPFHYCRHLRSAAIDNGKSLHRWDSTFLASLFTSGLQSIKIVSGCGHRERLLLP